MENRKTSWDYQKNRYKQLNIKFDMNDTVDGLLYHFISIQSNSTKVIKKLIYDELVRCAYEEE